MRLLFGQDAFVAEWVAARIPQMQSGEDFGPCSALGVVDEQGELLGGVVFHAYQPRFRNVELSFASGSRRWLTREIICALLRYPFDQLQCVRVTGVTPRKATSARRFLKQFGFKHEGLVRRGFGNDDAIISGLLRTEWRRSKWAQPLSERRKLREVIDGQERPEGSASA